MGDNIIPGGERKAGRVYLTLHSHHQNGTFFVKTAGNDDL